MFSVKGKFAEATIFTDLVEEQALSQIIEMLNQPITENTRIAIMPDVHAGTGSTIGTTISLPENKQDWRVCPNVIGVDLGCLDAETEYLTKSGWKKINSYNGEDEILIYDATNDVSYFEKPQAYIVKECNEFNYYKNSKGLDQMVCDEHNMLVFSGYKSKGYTKKLIHPKELNMLNLDKGYHGFKTSYNLSGGGIDYSMDEIRLIAMISADAVYRGVVLEDRHAYELHLIKQRKIDRAIKLLNNNNIKYKIYKSNIDKSIFILFKTKRFYPKDLSEFFKASKEQLKVLYSEALLWDGHINEKDSYYTTSKSNADVIQFAITSNNIRAGLYTTKYDKDWKDCYQVRLTKNNIVGYSNKSTRVKSQDGFKYCFSVSTSTFVARRNNKVFLTGNCGMMSYKLANKDINLKEIDEIVNKYIPSGFNIHSKPQNQKFTDSLIEDLTFATDNPERIGLSLGSLGGGNHFIEIAIDEDGSFWLTVHSGSRNLGVQVAKHHQKKAERSMLDVGVDKIIAELKAAGKERDIEKTIKEAKALTAGFNKELSFLTGDKLEQYLNDLALAQKFAHLNRKTMLDIIVEKAGLIVIDEFDSIHNFIDVEEGIIRKGATSAHKGERLIIPLNMRDGSLICVGKGNKEWNYSAPHGAGRMLSRSAAKKELDLDEFKNQMAGVYTTSVGESTLDEAPGAYKPMEAIIDNIGDTVDIIHHLKPVWNFKAH